MPLTRARSTFVSSLLVLNFLVVTTAAAWAAGRTPALAPVPQPLGPEQVSQPGPPPQLPGLKQLPTPPKPALPSLPPGVLTPQQVQQKLGITNAIPAGKHATAGRPPIWGPLDNPIFYFVPVYSTNSYYTFGVAVGDLNGDGLPDLLAPNYYSYGVDVLLQNSDGTFQPAVTYSSSSPYAYAVAVADVNGDGKLDVAVASYYDSSNTTGAVSIFLGNGDGTLQPGVSYASGGWVAQSVATGDVNGDGKPDLVLANQCISSADCSAGALGVLLGNGDGTFQAAMTFSSAGQYPNAIAVGDLNGDGHPDVVATTPYDSTGHGSVSVLLGAGDGTFQTAQEFASAGQGSRSVALVDLNSDGRLDVAIADQCSDSSCSAADVSVLLGNGDGTFQSPAQYGSGGLYAYSIAAGDMNGDGKPDLVINNQYANTTYNTGNTAVLVNNGDGTFQPAHSYVNGIAYYGIGAVALADLNGDGKMDVVSASYYNYGIRLLYGNGDGTLRVPASYDAGGSGPYSTAVGDFNGDGKPDLAVALANSFTVGILLGNGDGSYQRAVTYSAGTYPFSVAVGDFNGDGKLDLAVADYYDSTYTQGAASVLLGNGDGTFQNAVTYSSGGLYTFSVAVGDFNGDGRLDLALASQCLSNGVCSSGSAGILLGNGDGTFQNALTYPSSGLYTYAVAVGDFNGDSKTDLVLADDYNTSYSSGGASVLLGNGDGTFQNAVSYPSGGYGSYSVIVGDFNGDGKADLALSNRSDQQTSTYGTVGILLGSGDGTFQPATSYASGGFYPAYQSLAMADFNGDGKTDIAVANQCIQASSCITSSLGLLPGNGDGTFQAATSYPSDGGYGLATADLNGDGKPDLVVGNVTTNDNTVAVLLNLLNSGASATTTSVVSSANPSSLGQSVTFTATVAPLGSGTPTGTVSFYDGATLLGTGTLSGGAAGYSTSSLTLGSHSITAAYGGDSHFTGSTSSVLAQVVNPAATSTALTSSLNPSAYNQSVTFTASVTSSSGTPTGTVTFFDGAVNLGSSALNGSGMASLAVSSLSVGSHSITAAYGGDSNFGSSTSSALSQGVNQASSTTALASSLNPSTYNQPVTFTATITPQFGGGASGTVTFFDGTTALGSSGLLGNKATLSLSALSAGTHSMTARYSGDTNFTGSTSAVVPQQVNVASTTTAVTSSANPALVKNPVTFTATVTGQFGGGATGTMTFKTGAKTLGTSAVSGGVASFTVTLVTAGARSITASYSGDGNFAESTSPALNQQVQKLPSKVTLASSQNPSTVGQSVTFTATVTSNFGAIPNGETVTFLDGTTTLGTKTTTSGVATFTISSLAHGNHSITAKYAGDSNIKPATSAVLKQKVN